MLSKDNNQMPILVVNCCMIVGVGVNRKKQLNYVKIKVVKRVFSSRNFSYFSCLSNI